MNDALVPLADAIAALLDDVAELRHTLHSWPEPGFEETGTQARLRSVLEAAGLHPRVMARTGLVVDIGQGERCIALRADIDALRMTEANPDLPWRSKNEGVAHMCGHDGHSATMVGTARLLASVADRLPGRVRLLFQPAEEGPGGAPEMIEDGCLDGVSEVYGMHNWPAFSLGTLRTVAGPCMAHVAVFDIEVRGKGAHASQPQDGVDPVLVASHIVTAAQSIISRSVHYQERAVVSITTIHGGEVFNVIPDTVRLGGTIRVLSDEVWELVEARLTTLVEQTATAYGATAAIRYRRMYPALHNTAQETAHVERVARAVLGEQAVGSDQLPMLGAEDFAYYLQQRPGCFFFLGTGEDGLGNAPCHATSFDFNDNLLPLAMTLWIRLVEDRLGASLFA